MEAYFDKDLGVWVFPGEDLFPPLPMELPVFSPRPRTQKLQLLIGAHHSTKLCREGTVAHHSTALLIPNTP